MEISRGMTIVSVSKSLEPFQVDQNIMCYFGATLLAGRAGRFLAGLRKHKRLSQKRFEALAANAHVDRVNLKTHIVPWLQKSGFIEVGASPNDPVTCTVVDHEAVFTAIERLYEQLGPTPEELTVLGMVEAAAKFPSLEAEIAAGLPGTAESTIKTALGLARSYNIVKVLSGNGIREPVVYSPLIWGDNIGKAGRALSHFNPTKRAVLLQLVEMVRKYQGMPKASAVRWCISQGEPQLVDEALGLGLLDATDVTTSGGQHQYFLTTPHLYGEIAVSQGRDVCDRIKLFLDSIRHGQHFGAWHTGKISDPVVLLSRLLDNREIGPCTAIGTDYVLVEQAGIVRVKRSEYKRGQYVMQLTQDDTVQMVRDILANTVTTGVVLGGGSRNIPSQDVFESAEQTRAKLGELPPKVQEAEAQMLQNLREMI
jgi:hypothetical protein